MEDMLEDKCGYYNESRNQRNTERERGLGNAGTAGFERMGCYDCDGNNRKCKAYFNPLGEYNKGFGK